MKYRKELDGLRAVAVLAVIADHLPGDYLRSGYLGVDVFFAISGFVITASLLGQRPASVLGLYADFFARRVKRLLPALFVFVGLTSLYVVVNDPSSTKSIHTAVWSLFGLSNIELYRQQLDYFAESSRYNAFTHTWSLGVEEQFYFFFPLVVWIGLFARGGSSNHKRLAQILTVLSLASLIAFIYLYDRNQPAAYFLMPMRIWELGVGALTYIFLATTFSERITAWANRNSLVLISLLFLTFLAPLEHGVIATIVAILLTACILMTSASSRAGRLLSTSVAVFIGRISYSLYLWHWAVISQRSFGIGDLTSFPELVALVLMFVLAITSYNVIEKPLRHKVWASKKGYEAGIGFSFALVIAVIILGNEKLGLVHVKQNLREMYPHQLLPLVSSQKPFLPTCLIEPDVVEYPTMFEDCTVRPSKNGMPMLWVVGDSHAQHLQSMLYAMHDTLGVGVHLTVNHGYAFPFSDEGKNKFPYRQVLFDRIIDELAPGDVVLVARLYQSVSNDKPVALNFDDWLNTLPGLAQRISEKGAELVLFGPLPFFAEIKDIRQCSLANRQLCAVRRDEMLSRFTLLMPRLREWESEQQHIHVFEPFDTVCPATQEWCYADDGKVFIYYDKSHLNVVGSRALAAPFTEALRNWKLLENQDQASQHAAGGR